MAAVVVVAPFLDERRWWRRFLTRDPATDFNLGTGDTIEIDPTPIVHEGFDSLCSVFSLVFSRRCHSSTATLATKGFVGFVSEKNFRQLATKGFFANL